MHGNTFKKIGTKPYEIQYGTEKLGKLKSVMLHTLPNLAYLHDIGVIHSRGAILLKMCPGGREKEEIILREALTNLGILIFHEFIKGDMFEGHLILSPDTLLVENT